MRYILPLSALLLAGSFSAPAAVDSGLLALVPPGHKNGRRYRCRARPKFCVRSIHAQQDQHGRCSLRGVYWPNRIRSSPRPAGGCFRQPSFHERSGALRRFAILGSRQFQRNQIRSNGAGERRHRSAVSGNRSGASESQTGQRSGFAFLDGGVAVMGDLATLQQIVANRAAPSALDPRCSNRFRSAGTDNDAWFVSESRVLFSPTN